MKSLFQMLTKERLKNVPPPEPVTLRGCLELQRVWGTSSLGPAYFACSASDDESMRCIKRFIFISSHKKF